MTSKSCERSSRVIHADVQSRFTDSRCSAGCCHLMHREFELARCKILIIQSAKGQRRGRRKRGAVDEAVVKQAIRWMTVWGGSVCVYCSLSSAAPRPQLHPCSLRPLFFLLFLSVTLSLSLSLALPVIKSHCHWSPATSPGSGCSATGGWSREGKERGESVWVKGKEKER